MAAKAVVRHGCRADKQCSVHLSGGMLQQASTFRPLRSAPSCGGSELHLIQVSWAHMSQLQMAFQSV